MTSAAAPGPESLQEIHKLFSWNPPPLTLDSRKKPSTVKRRPSFFDKHLSRDLVLKRVQRLPSLVQDLARNVDIALTAASNTLPPLSGFITAQQREDDIWTNPPTVTDEKGVADFYNMTTAKYCSRVASTLALHPTASFSRWISLVFWTQSVSHSGYAITDGQLCFLGETGLNGAQKTLRGALVAGMDSATRHIFEEMAKSRSAVGTWEIKSLSTDSVEALVTIPNLGDFSWTTCTVPNCHKNPRHRTQKMRVALLQPAGPDSLAPPWSLLDSSSDLPPLPAHQRLTRSAAKSGDSTLPSTSTIPSSEHRSNKRQRGSDNGGPRSTKKSKQDVGNGEHAPTKTKGKERQLDDDNDDDGDNDGDNDEDTPPQIKESQRDDDGAYQDVNDISAHSLVQQAWAQAVNVDGTVIVLHSGNHELVCIRHRASQTLYVSDIIEPPTCANPGYGKLHVGIYLAAIRDTMDRKRQPQPKRLGDSGDLFGGDEDLIDKKPFGSGRKDDHGHSGGGRSGGRGLERNVGFQGSAGKSGPTATDGKLEEIIHIASQCDVVFLYLQYNVYDSPVPATFIRSAAAIMLHPRCSTPFSPRAVHACGLEECQTIVLTSEIGHGATGVVLRGTLTLEIWDDARVLEVVVKLAFDIGQRKALKSEHEVYRHLQSKGIHRGIKIPLGFFDDSEGSACTLVMPYAGVPLSELHRKLSISECESALSTLEFIHLAGILHGDIRLENVLLGDSGITIIDFGHSRRSDNRMAKDKEFAQLRLLLIADDK